MENYIIVVVLVLILGAALIYLIRAKRRGQKCVGCPYAKQCEGGCAAHAPSKKKNKNETK